MPPYGFLLSQHNLGFKTAREIATFFDWTIPGDRDFNTLNGNLTSDEENLLKDLLSTICSDAALERTVLSAMNERLDCGWRTVSQFSGPCDEILRKLQKAPASAAQV